MRSRHSRPRLKARGGVDEEEALSVSNGASHLTPDPNSFLNTTTVSMSLAGPLALLSLVLFPLITEDRGRAMSMDDSNEIWR